jgi:anti-sigma B factor antagonist
MSDPLQPTFLVSAYSDPIVVQINGKANYLNCNAFREFIGQMVDNGKGHIVLDFENCNGMDSTFLGILAGTALELRKQTPAGVLTLSNLGRRNHELVCNLGLQNLLTIAEQTPDRSGIDSAAEFSALKNAKISDANNVLRAHEDLVKADTENASKFQDVIAFLKNQVETDYDI